MAYRWLLQVVHQAVAFEHAACSVLVELDSGLTVIILFQNPALGKELQAQPGVMTAHMTLHARLRC